VQAGLAVLLMTTNIIHTGPLLPVKTVIEARPGWFESSSYLRRAYHTFLREVRLSSPFYRYLQEIRHPYRGPLDAVVRFFKTHGKPGETCYIDNEVEAFAFYTGMKMIRDQEITPQDRPNWIVLRGSRTDLAGGAPPADAVDRTLNHILQTGSYKTFILHSTPRRHNNSYEIQLHLYKSPPSTGRLYIYQRVTPLNKPAD